MSSGLFHSLNIGSQSLHANKQGMNTTAHNIANAQTEGYSRQKIQLKPRAPVLSLGTVIGNGVQIEEIKRSHDKFIEQELTKAQSHLGDSSIRFAEMARIGDLFNPELGSNISQKISNFFDSLQSLSSAPEDLSLRTSVREQALNLTRGFQELDLKLSQNRTNLNDHVRTTTTQVSDLLTNIANLNGQIKQMEATPSDNANDLRDQRDLLVRHLGELVNIHYYDDANGMVTIRGPGQAVLVDGIKAASLGIRANDTNEGMYDVLVYDFEGRSSRSITPDIESGQLKGLIDVRDKTVSDLLQNNNTMAKTLVDNINEIHQKGYGTGEFRQTDGRNFFKQLSSSENAAKNITLDDSILSSVNAISAASAPNAPGDNVNANTLLSLKNERLFAEHTASFTDFYANYVGILGTETERTRLVSEADKVLHTDLFNRREALSGVSLDEEAAEMLRWQNAFTASSKIITTIDEMLDTILNMKR